MGRYEEWLANHPNNPDNQNRETNTGSTQTTGGSRYEEWRANHPNNPNRSSTGAGAGGTAPASGTTWSTGTGGGRSYIKTFQEWQEKNPGYRYMITDEDGNERWDEDGWNYYLENVSGTDAQGNELTGVDALDYLDRYEQHMRQMLGMEESTGAEDGEKFADYYQPQRYEGVYVYSGEDEGLKNYVNLLNEQRLLDSDGTAQREFIADPYPWMKQTQGRLAEEAKQIQELEKKYGEAERKGSYRQGGGLGGYVAVTGVAETERKEAQAEAEKYAALLAKAQADYAKDERDYGTMTEMFGTPEEKEAADRYEAWVNDRLGSGKTWEEIYADAVRYAEDAQGWKQDAYNDLTKERRENEQATYTNMWAGILGEEETAPEIHGDATEQALSRLDTAQQVNNRAQEQLIFAERNRYRDLTDSPDYDKYAEDGKEIVKGQYGNAGPAKYSEEEIAAAKAKVEEAQRAFGQTTSNDGSQTEKAEAYARLETARQELERMQTGSKGTQEREWWQKLAYAMATPFGQAAIGYSENDPYARPTEDWSEEELKLYYAITSQRGEEEAASYAREVNNSIGEKSKAEKLQPITEKTLGAETLGRKLGTDAAAFAGQVAAMPGRLFSWADKMAQTIGTGETAAESGYVSLADRADARMSAVSERQNRDYGTVNEDIPVIGGKGIGDLTQVLGSVLPSIVSGNLIGEAGTLLLFFGSAADSGYDEAIERGASAGQAAWYSILTGAAEVAGEKISLENLLSGNISGSMWKEILKQAGIEGSEEGFTTLLNTLSDALIMQDKSQYNERIAELTMNGTDYETAVRQAFKETADSLAWDIVGGAISGGVSSGIQQGAMRIASAPARRAMQQADADLNALQENEQKLQQAQEILSDEELKAQAEGGDTGAQERRTQAQETAAEARERLNELDTKYRRRAADGSEQGAAMQAEVEGERKEIKSFAYDEKTRKVYAVTTDGTDFNASEARLDRGTEYLVQQAEQHPKLADDMLNLYQQGQSVERYANAFIMTAELWGANSSLTEDEAYRASRLSNSVAYDLTTKQFRRAFELGQRTRTEAAQESAAPSPAARYGVWSTYEDVTIDGVTYKAAKPSQIDPLLGAALDTLSKLFKTDIRLYASEADKSGKYSGRNGFYKDGVIYVDINAHANSTAEKSAVLLTIAHELTHELRESNEAGYRELRDFVIEHMVRSGTDIEQLAREKISESGNPNMSLDDAVEEIVCNASERMLLNTKYAELMEKEKPNLFDAIRKWLSGLRDRIQKIFEGEGYSRENAYKEAKILWDVMDEMQEVWDRNMTEAQRRRTAETQDNNGTKQDNNGTKNSIRETEDGRFVAIVDNDILSNIDTSSWTTENKAQARKAAVAALKKFKDGIVVNGVTHSVNKRSRDEYTRSKYTMRIYKKEKNKFADKMRTADIIDDVIIATTDWNRDGKLKHPRSDNFVDFDHGKVLLQAGKNKYKAEVVVGITNNGEAVFYDITNLEPDRFKIKNAEIPTDATTQEVPGTILGETAFEKYIPQDAENVKGEDTLYSSRERQDTAEEARGRETGARTSSREWFNEDKYYARQIDQWDRKADGVRVKVGTLKEGSALNRVGFPAEGMWFDVGKIKKSFDKHRDHLTREILKQIPELLNDPIAITEYRGQDGQTNNTANVFGLLLPDGKTPVVVGVVMTRAADGITVINKIRTIHAHGNADINDDNVLYLNENKKKTRNWFQVCGNSVPLNGTRYGLIRTLTYKDADVKSSIRETDDGRFVAVVDNDILSEIDTSNWNKEKKKQAKKAAAEALKKFSNGIAVEGITRAVNKISRHEYTGSKYTEGLYRKDKEKFADKMRAASIADDVLVASTDWNRDGRLKHPRTDNFVDFDHGTTLIQSGENKYSAEVVVGITDEGEAVFYDVVDLTPGNFKIKNADTLSAVTTQEVPDGVLKVSASDAKIPQTDADVKSKAKFSLREKKTPTYEELVSKTPVRIVDVRSGIESGTYAEMKGEVLEKAIEEKWFDEPHLNEDTNSLIFLTPKSFSHAFTNLTADFGEDTIRSMVHIPEIIKDAVLVSVNEPKNNHKAETGVYTFFGAINGANGIEPVKLTVKEYDFKSLDGMPQNIRSYFNRNGIMEQYDTLYDTQALEVIGIESIKEEPDASVKVGEQSPLARDTSGSSEIKIADLLELVKGDAEKYIPERGGQFKGSSREYNYDYLASKDDMQLTEVVPKERYSRSDIVAEGMKNAAMFGYTNNSGNAVVYIKDTDTDVIVTEKSIRHGLDRRINNQAPVIEKLGEVLSNSVKVNELIPRTENTEKTFVYVGAAKDTDNRLYIATFIVNRNTNELESYDVLYAANAKKEPAALLPTSTDNSAMFTGSVISISDLLDKVNKLFPDILSEDVLRHFGRTERPQGKIGENVLYSSRETRDTAEEAKGREESAAVLRRENRILRERIEYWKKQSRVTKEYTLRNTDTLEYARELVKRLDSAATSAEVNQGLQEMGAYLLNAENVDWDMLWEHALTLAHSMTDDVDIVISDEMKAEREDFESFLKSVPVDVAPLVKAGEISYSDLKGYPIVHRKNGTSLDDLYQQLQERFGEGIFPDVPDGGDRIDNIKRYADAVQEIRGNPYADYLDETATLTALEIIDKLTSGELRQSLPTPMDRAEKKLNDQKEKAREQIAKIRRDKNARIAQIKAEGSARTQQRVAAERAKRTEAIKEVSAKYREMIQQANSRRRENADRKKYREQVERIAGKLGAMLESNSDKKHIPEALKGTVENVLKSIDLTSTTYLKTGEQTQKDAGFFASMSKLNDILNDQNKALRGEEGSDGLDMYLDISDEVKQIMQEFVNKAREADIAGASYTVNDMDAAELRNLSMILTNLDHAVRDMNELFVKSKYENVTALAGAVIRYLDNLGKDRTRSKAGETVRQFLAWENLTPYYAFKRLGEGGETLFKGLRQGWDKLAYNAGDIIEFTNGLYTAKEARQWQKHINSFTLEDGTKIQMTDAQIMAYHCLSKREQARLHIDGGGIRIADIDTKAGQVKQTDHVRLSLKDMAMLERVLTDRQVEVADAMQKFMVEVCGEWGNEISMARYGYRAFTERNYFPIEVDGNDGKLVDPEVKSSDMWRLLNLSATKSTVPNAERALVIHDIFEVFTAHSADMAKYNALALPLLDLLKVVNYKDRIELDEKGAIKTKTTQKSLERAYGNIAKKYMTTFIKDMNSAHEGGTTTADRLTKRIISRYKAASVGANIRVAIQQPTAYVRAAMVLNPKYLAQGLKPVKGSTEEMLKHSGIAAWKDLGFVSTDIGRGMRDQIMHTETLADELTEKSMTLAEWGDKITWSALWRAAKAEVSDTTGLIGEELLKKTAERFEEIVYSTQVVDATMTRSHNMRNPGILAAMSTAYMAEPTLSYNIVLDAFSEWQRLKREGQNVKPAAEKMVRAIASYAASGAATLLAASLWDAFRDDDEYESFWQKYTSALFGDRQTKWYQSNVMQELLIWNKIPVLKDIWAVAMGDSVERMDMQPIQNMWKAIQIDWEAMQIMLGNVVPDEGEYSQMTGYGKLMANLRGFAQISGLPLYNMTRDVIAIYNTALSGFTGQKLRSYVPDSRRDIRDAYLSGFMTEEDAMKELVKTERADDENDAYWILQSWNKGNDVKSETMTAVLDAVKAGDRNAYTEAVKELTEHGVHATDIRSEITDAVQKWYQGTEQEKKSISKEQAVQLLTDYAKKNIDAARKTVEKWTCRLVTGMDFSSIRTEYIDGNISESRAVELYSTYGYGDRSKQTQSQIDEGKASAEELVRKWKCTKETGMNYDSLQDYYAEGVLSYDDVKEWYIRYGGKTEEDAVRYANKTKFIGADSYPGITVKNTDVYYEYVDGMDKKLFAEAAKSVSKMKGEDKDGDGKSDAYSAMDKKLAYINGLPLSAEEKTRLAEALIGTDGKLSAAAYKRLPWK